MDKANPKQVRCVMSKDCSITGCFHKYLHEEDSRCDDRLLCGNIRKCKTGKEADHE